MANSLPSKSQQLRSGITHPVIDSDGHTLEFLPGYYDYLRQIAGHKIVDRYKRESNSADPAGSLGNLTNWFNLTPEQRRSQRAPRSPWWAIPSKNTLDRATAMLPKLLNERLDEFGIDFTVLYPTLGLLAPHLEDEELRRAGCRAFNSFHADIFREYCNRMTPVAVIPMHTPAEAISELDYAVNTLKMKAVMLAGHVVRTVPAAAAAPWETRRYAYWIDNLCLDSEYDYDPVWAKCVELGVPATFHSVGMGWGSRTSISNWKYNHIGHFAAAGEALCKAMFFGGVTRRFPTLKCAFLEGGVAWACSLYADLVEHWSKRNRTAIESLNPAALNRPLLRELCERYGGKLVQEKLADNNWWALQKADLTRSGDDRARQWESDEAMLDEWARCEIKRPEDIRDLFVPNFFFGCEADDRLNALAFNGGINPFGARLKAVLSSDIGHWDVPDMREVLEEAHELVDYGLMTEEDFRDFAFVYPAELWTSMNPNFFKGTIVEGAVDRLLGCAPHAAFAEAR
jgi:predicted TIM-barrel fold metal-dependent hydrolase